MRIVFIAIFVLSSCFLGRAQSTPAFTEVFGFPFNSAATCQPDGTSPTSGVMQAPDGFLYGITSSSADNAQTCPAVIFQITSTGQFSAGAQLPYDAATGTFPDGRYPFTNLIVGLDGSIYGAAGYGGTSGDGAIFRIDRTGAVQVVHNFCSELNCADGQGGFGLSLGIDGNFYGSTFFGGAYDGGVILRRCK